MKRKFIAIISALSMLGAPAAAAEDTVEIKFSVGDSVLTVNGNPLEVTAPYVVGDGTTLVPVRVITEAFGAEVSWDGATQSVSLKYPDVDITIQIGSKSATVNSHTEELQAAPELFNDTTMVPLRFISETFGATVDYEAQTQLITVTKTARQDSTDTVEGVTDAQYIGDSYFGWRIQNPKTLVMSDRSFDGERTIFTDGNDNCMLTIGIDINGEDIDVDTEYNNLKDIMSTGTISVADRDTLSDGTVKIHFRGKDKTMTDDAIEYIKGDTAYYTLLSVKNDYEGINDLLALNGTFEINASGEYYDLSNVENGYREFNDEEYKVTLKIPAEWTQIESDVTNELRFINMRDDISALSIGIYSKSASVTAEALANHDRESRAAVTNHDNVIVSDVKNDGGRYSYTAKYQGGGRHSYELSDVFFENGDYVYNVSAEAKTLDEANKLINSVKAETLDPSVVGTLLRSSDLGGGSSVKTIAGGKMTVPNMWDAYVSGTLRDSRTGGILSVSYNTGNGNYLQQMTDELVRSIRDEGHKIVKNVSSKRVNNNQYYCFTVEQKNDDEIIYTTVYTVSINGRNYMFSHARNDIYYTGSVDDEVEEMVYSFTFE